MDSKRFQQIEDLYNAVCACNSEKRSALLDQADPELKREVELLLAQKGSALDRPVWAGAANMLETKVTETIFTAGTQLGPYLIEALLGAGGMGQVFRGVDTRLGRPVAIKLAHRQFGDRFQREAHAISALNHPHICTLYDVGATPSGASYLVMELVEGDTLAARLKKGALPMDQALRYGTEIADALAAAHAKGITHRDLKPGNIMLAKSGVKVLDFGLARSTQDETLTLANAVMGTPAYMAPEQKEGRACDARTDIYALGLILAEMAKGKRQTTQELGGSFGHIVERCLANDPDSRWQSASDIKFELEWAAKTPAGITGNRSSAGGAGL